MTPKTTALLSDPHPHCHIVYPYSDESHIAEAVTLFAGSGISNNEAVVLITTDAHRTAIETRLLAEGYDIGLHEREGRLRFIDADNMLCQLYKGETPDRELFQKLADQLIETARQNSRSGKVRLFGEMVNLLCGHNNVEAAAQLEDLWNETIERQDVPLLCSYSLEVLQPHGHTLPNRLAEAHSDIAA
jgi:hypothetical protein